jgi:hypothetical protein
MCRPAQSTVITLTPRIRIGAYRMVLLVSMERSGCVVAKGRGMPRTRDMVRPRSARSMRARHLFNSLWLLLLVALRPGCAQERSEPACSACHDQNQKLQLSAHAALACTTCHQRHEPYPHPAGIPKPGCGQCHTNVAGEHAQSAHGEALKQGNAGAPDCAVCECAGDEPASPHSWAKGSRALHGRLCRPEPQQRLDRRRGRAHCHDTAAVALKAGSQTVPVATAFT